jgi:hypothetical protein
MRARMFVLAAAASLSALGAGPAPAADTAAPAAEVRLGVAGRRNSGAAVAADGATVVVAWAAVSDAGTDVYAAFSRDGGATFGAPVRVNDVPGDARMSGEQAPRVSIGGGVQVVWLSRQGIRAALAAPGTEKFAPAVTVNAAGLKGMRGWQSLAMGREGVPHVAWLDGRGDAGGPAALTDGRKGLRQDLFQAVRRADGTFAETRVAKDVCFCCKTAVAASAEGAVYVAWRHIYPPNVRDIAVARSADGGRTFGPPVRVSADGWAIDGCPDDGPSIAVGPRGRLHVAWPTLLSTEAGKGVFYSWSLDGRTFAPRQRLDEGPGGAAHPHLALSGDRVVVAWEQKGDSGSRIYARTIAGDPVSAAAAPRVGPATPLGTAGAGSYPAVAAAADAIVAAWTEETAGGSEIKVRRMAW